MLIEKALSEAARKALVMEPHIEKFFTEAHRRSYAEGKSEGKAEGLAEGKAEGKAASMLTILQQRGLAMTDEQQRQIRSCTDLAILDRWLARVLSVASVDELLV